MCKVRIKQIAFYTGLISLLIGVIAFTLSWNFWENGMPGYRFFLFPGNLMLALFTEEIDFWLKLVILLIGLFSIVAVVTNIGLSMYNYKIMRSS